MNFVCTCGNYEPRITNGCYNNTAVMVCKNCGRHQPDEFYLSRFMKDKVPEYDTFSVSVDDKPEEHTSESILESALKHIKDRASTYDNPKGERSIPATVSAFNSVTGHTLTSEQGWLFMALLKMVRSQQGEFKMDNYEDLTAYSSLMGECANMERKK